VRAQVNNGLAYASSVNELEAQLLQAGQARTELRSARKAWLDMLGLFIGRELPEDSWLVRPPDPTLTDSVSRPELALFEYQKRSFALQDDLAAAQLRPKLGLFAQGGYGRPGMNMLSNDFALYSIGGLRMTWNLGGLYTLKNQQRLSELGRRSLDVQKETFLFNIQASRKQHRAGIAKFLELLKTDEQIIQKRVSVKNAAGAQLENGVLNAHDYLTQVDAENQARQNEILHRLQLLALEYEYRNLTGAQ
ncbi:MAG: transporter, partial [Bacteroidota bacterium]|nr:transporter [Bacteroidota bacterium]